MQAYQAAYLWCEVEPPGNPNEMEEIPGKVKAILNIFVQKICGTKKRLQEKEYAGYLFIQASEFDNVTRKELINLSSLIGCKPKFLYKDERVITPKAEIEQDKEDAKLEKETRLKLAKMGSLRHAEVEEKRKLWEPFIREMYDLIDKGISKSNAAKRVSKNHPEAKINPQTLRQKKR